jgi:hypothetical protein
MSLPVNADRGAPKQNGRDKPGHLAVALAAIPDF